MKEELKDRLTSRKFMGAVVVFIAATALLGFDQITGQEWVQAALGIYGIYGVSNAASKFGEAQKTRAGVEVTNNK